MNVKDIVGQRFGKLIVVSFAESRMVGQKRKAKKRFYNVKCDCGKAKVVCRENLIYGSCKSCGCVNIKNVIERNHNLRLPDNFSHWNRYYKCHLKDAKNRNIETQISFDEFKEICQKNCHYCGSSPERKSHKNLYGEIYRNTMDRIDPIGFYCKENIHPCCWTCNRMKSNYTHEFFLSKIKQINKHLNLKNE